MAKVSNKTKKSKKQAEDDVDYAAAADSFADADDGGLLVENGAHADDNENESNRGSMGGDNDDEEEDDHDAGSDGGRSSDEDGGGSDGDSVSEGGESEGSEEGSGSSDESDGDNLDDEDDEDAQGRPVDPSKAVRSASSSHPEACTFDLRNLLAMNTHQVDTVALYKQPPKTKVPSDEGKAITIPGDSMPAVANDDVLLRMATDGCQQLIAALWQLPVERSDAGPLVTLPGYEEVRIPRALVRWPKENALVG
jgi:Ribosome biogenesis regulatory protein (RRS1)